MQKSTNFSEIASFLQKSKVLISNQKFDFVPRRKNMMSLAEYGLTIKDAKEEILELKISDYYKGPKKDFDKPGDIWEFKKDIQGVCFYIKIKIVIENKREVLKCIGFHRDDYII